MRVRSKEREGAYAKIAEFCRNAVDLVCLCVQLEEVDHVADGVGKRCDFVSRNV